MQQPVVEELRTFLERAVKFPHLVHFAVLSKNKDGHPALGHSWSYTQEPTCEEVEAVEGVRYVSIQTRLKSKDSIEYSTFDMYRVDGPRASISRICIFSSISPDEARAIFRDVGTTEYEFLRWLSLQEKGSGSAHLKQQTHANYNRRMSMPAEAWAFLSDVHKVEEAFFAAADGTVQYSSVAGAIQMTREAVAQGKLSDVLNLFSGKNCRLDEKTIGNVHEHSQKSGTGVLTMVLR